MQPTDAAGIDLPQPFHSHFHLGPLLATIAIVIASDPALSITLSDVMEGSKALSTAPRAGPRSTDELLLSLYAELHRVAEFRLRQAGPGQTLQATALVHEAYLRLVEKSQQAPLQWTSRAHFFFVAARAMRDIVVERARRRQRLRRRTPNDGRQAPAAAPAGATDASDLADRASSDIVGGVDAIALHEAMARLAEHSDRMHQVVMLRVFAGLPVAQIAELLNVDERTVGRDWRFARAWLSREMGGIGT